MKAVEIYAGRGLSASNGSPAPVATQFSIPRQGAVLMVSGSAHNSGGGHPLQVEIHLNGGHLETLEGFASDVRHHARLVTRMIPLSDSQINAGPTNYLELHCNGATIVDQNDVWDFWLLK